VESNRHKIVVKARKVPGLGTILCNSREWISVGHVIIKYGTALLGIIIGKSDEGSTAC